MAQQRSKGKPKRRPKTSNLERSYGEYLEQQLRAGEIRAYWHQAERFHLAELPDGVQDPWYKPDYRVLLNDWTIQQVEVKGRWRTADRIRIKVAAAQYWDQEWVGVQWDRKEKCWKYEHFN